ncbi:MAG: NHL repeat-containing protein [Nitrospirota bacterium]
MNRSLLTSLMVLSAVLLLPVLQAGADTVKLRPVVSAYGDMKGAGFSEPEGVGCGTGQQFIIADTGHGRLQQFQIADDGIKPGAEIKVPQINYPQRVRLNSQGDIFVLDGKQHRIIRLNAAGQFKSIIAAKGIPGPVPSMMPRSFAIDKADTIYVLDVLSSRVVIAGPDDVYRKQIAFPQGNGFFSDLAVDASGTLFLLNSVTGSVYSAAAGSDVFTLLVKDLRSFSRFPTSLAVDQKRIYVVDQYGGGVAVLGRDGAFQGHKLKTGWKEGELRYPSDICLMEAGYVMISDRGNNRVQVFMLEDENK